VLLSQLDQRVRRVHQWLMLTPRSHERGHLAAAAAVGGAAPGVRAAGARQVPRPTGRRQVRTAGLDIFSNFIDKANESTCCCYIEEVYKTEILFQM